MGTYLSSPRTEKQTATVQNAALTCAASDMQGWRMTMEDARISQLDIAPGTSVFGVFDGHGGSEVALFVAKHYTAELLASRDFQAADKTRLLQNSFLRMDELILAPEGQKELVRIQRNLPEDAQLPNQNADSMAGCTAVVALVEGRRIWVANAGDSRCILGRAGRPVEMSMDHKPELPEEYARIIAAGGMVEDGRVMGNINLSRSIGDFEYKRGNMPPSQQIVTAFPEVKHAELTLDTDFMVLACDGIWDMVTNEQCAQFIYDRLKDGLALERIVEELLDHCLATDIVSSAGLGCDNMTCMIIKFTH